MARIPDLPAQSIRDHERILDAIGTGASEDARRIAEQHLRVLIEQFRIERFRFRS